MSTVGDNIRALRKQHSLSQLELADIAGVSRGAIAKWESGETSFIRRANLKPILEHFGISEDDLLSDAMGIAAQQAAGRLQVSSGSDRAAFLPLLPKPAAAFEPISAFEQVEVPVTVASKHPRAFGLLVGSSDVDRQIPGGSVVIIDPEKEPDQGDISLVNYQGNNYLRRLFRGAMGFMLSPDTHVECPDIFISGNDATIIGPVVWWQPAFAKAS